MRGLSGYSLRLLKEDVVGSWRVHGWKFFDGRPRMVLRLDLGAIPRGREHFRAHARGVPDPWDGASSGRGAAMMRTEPSPRAWAGRRPGRHDGKGAKDSA